MIDVSYGLWMSIHIAMSLQEEPRYEIEPLISFPGQSIEICAAMSTRHTTYAHGGGAQPNYIYKLSLSI